MDFYEIVSNEHTIVKQDAIVFIVISRLHFDIKVFDYLYSSSCLKNGHGIQEGQKILG